MPKNPVRHRYKHVRISCDSVLSTKRYRKLAVAWEDVYLVFKEGSHKNGSKRGLSYLGPTVISEDGLRSDIAEEKRLIASGHVGAERIARSIVDIAEYEALLARLAAGEDYIIVDNKYNEAAPAVYVQAPLNRDKAEKASIVLLASVGVRNVKLVWERRRNNIFIHPC